MMKKRNIDYSLYLVTDRKLSLGRSLLEVIRPAVEGGVTVVQLREKEVDSREFYREAVEIKEFLDERDIPLIINDRLDIALAIDAAGVHLGQEDLPVDVARKILGPGKIIGASVFTPDEAIQAEAHGGGLPGALPHLCDVDQAGTDEARSASGGSARYGRQPGCRWSASAP